MSRGLLKISREKVPASSIAVTSAKKKIPSELPFALAAVKGQAR
jgi:hypothetical protein